MWLKVPGSTLPELFNVTYNEDLYGENLQASGSPGAFSLHPDQHKSHQNQTRIQTWLHLDTYGRAEAGCTGLTASEHHATANANSHANRPKTEVCTEGL